MPELGKIAEEGSLVPWYDSKKWPNTASAQRERRRRFDEEWNGVSELLVSVPLEPLVVNVATSPEDTEEVGGQILPRTTDELADEILENFNSRFNFL